VNGRREEFTAENAESAEKTKTCQIGKNSRCRLRGFAAAKREPMPDPLIQLVSASSATSAVKSVS